MPLPVERADHEGRARTEGSVEVLRKFEKRLALDEIDLVERQQGRGFR